jgi:nitrate reductase beta subunit
MGKPGSLEGRLDPQANGKIQPRIGGKWRVLANIFANPDMPEIDDYYEPFTFDYEHLQKAPELEAFPTARPRSLISGERMEKIEWGPNWEEILGGEFSKRSADKNFEGVQKEIYGQFENTFMMYLPRLCEHCLNPACAAACPSGAIYKREEDGIVLIDQDKCRGWRMCVSGCPYKKIYFNWSSGKSEKCIFCYPRIEAGQPTVCSETCVGRIRYLGVMLYDADRIEAAASAPDEKDLYEAQIGIFLDPNDPAVIAAGARATASRRTGSKRPAARRSGRWRWSGRSPSRCIPNTARCRWSGTCRRCRRSQSAAEAGKMGIDGEMPDVRSLRIPLRYLANLLTAGDEKPVALGSRAHAGHARLHAGQDRRRRHRRSHREARRPDGRADRGHVPRDGDRQLRGPLRHPDDAPRVTEDAYELRGSCGFSFGDGCCRADEKVNLFGGVKREEQPEGRSRLMKTLKVLSALLSYPVDTPSC